MFYSQIGDFVHDALPAQPTAELQCLKAFLRTDDHDSQNSLKSGSGHDMMLSKAQQIYTSKVSN